MAHLGCLEDRFPFCTGLFQLLSLLSNNVYIHLQPHSLSVSRCISHKFPSASATHLPPFAFLWHCFHTFHHWLCLFTPVSLVRGLKTTAEIRVFSENTIQSHQRMLLRFPRAGRHLEHTESQNNGQSHTWGSP